MVRIPALSPKNLDFQKDDTSDTTQKELETELTDDGLPSTSSLINLLQSASTGASCSLTDLDTSSTGTVDKYAVNSGNYTLPSTEDTDGHFMSGLLEADCPYLMTAFTGVRDVEDLCTPATTADVQTAFECYITNCDSAPVLGESTETTNKEKRAEDPDFFRGFFDDTTDPMTPQFLIDYQAEFTADFKLIQDEIVSDLKNTNGLIVHNGITLACHNCSIQVSSLRVSGLTSINFKTNKITKSLMYVQDNSVANVQIGFEAKRGVVPAGSWNFNTASLRLNSTTKNNFFSVEPVLFFSPGASVETTSAVSSANSGLDVTWPGSTATFDIIGSNLLSKDSWTPVISNYEPAIGLSPTDSMYMTSFLRKSYQFTVKLFGKPIENTIAITGQAGVSNTGTGSSTTCGIGQVLVSSYTANEDQLVLSNGTSYILDQNSQNLVTSTCRTIPAIAPSFEEIAILRQSYGPYCSSVLAYNGPTTDVKVIGTSVNIVSTSTLYIPSYVTTIPTSTTTTTITMTATREASTTVTVTGTFAGQETIPQAYYKREVADPLHVVARFVSNDTFEAESTDKAGAGLEKRDLSPPTFANLWDPAQSTYACQQVATGGVLTTITSAVDSIVTSVETIQVATKVNSRAVQDTLVSTVTATSVVFTTTDPNPQTRTIDASCPLQTNKSCFKIKAKSDSQRLNGRYLGVSDESTWSSFYNPATAFYITCKGLLISLPDFRPLSFGSNGVLAFPGSGTGASHGANYFSNSVCKRDILSQQLTCSDIKGNTAIYAYDPANPYWTSNFSGISAKYDSFLGVPSFNFLGSSSGPYLDTDFTAVSLLTEPTTCPCISPNDAIEPVDPTNFATSTICPNFDSGAIQIQTLPFFPSVPVYPYETFQVQCGLVYPADYRSIIPLSGPFNPPAQDAYSCGSLCTAYPRCVAAQWLSDSSTCQLLSSAIGAPVRATDQVNYLESNMILARLSPPPAWSQVILNNTFPLTSSSGPKYSPWIFNRPITAATDNTYALSFTVINSASSSVLNYAAVKQPFDDIIPSKWYVYSIVGASATQDMQVSIDFGDGVQQNIYNINSTPDGSLYTLVRLVQAPANDISKIQLNFAYTVNGGAPSATFKLGGFSMWGPFDSTRDARTFAPETFYT